MVNYQLVDWIRQNQANGYGINSLRDSLLQGGYPQNDIDEAIRAVVTPAPLTPTSLASVEIKKKDDEDKKKKKLIIGIIAAIAGILLVLLLLILLWPSTPLGAPTVAALPVNTSFIPDNMTISAHSISTISLYTTQAGSKKEFMTSEANVEINKDADLKNDKSSLEALISTNGTILTKIIPVAKTRIIVYQINGVMYSKFDLKVFIEDLLNKVAKTVGMSPSETEKLISDLENKLEKTFSTTWVKTTAGETNQKDNPSQGIKIQTLSEQYQEIKDSRIEIIEENKVTGIKHIRVTPSQSDMTKIVNQAPISSLGPLVSAATNDGGSDIASDIKGVANNIQDIQDITKREINYSNAIEVFELDYWVDNQGKIVKNSLNYIFVLNSKNAPYKDPEMQKTLSNIEIRATLSSFMEIKDYNNLGRGIVLPSEAGNAITFEEFQKKMADEITKSITESASAPKV